MKVRIRNDSVYISGYVNAVGRDSKLIKEADGSEYVEQMAPGVFADALRKATEPVKALRNHDPALVLGENGQNLRLEEDNIGLYAELETSDPATIEKARAKKLRGWSFGFVDLNFEREYTFSGKERRIRTEIDLKEVSLLDDEKYPAYTGTSVNARELVLRSYDTDFEYEEEPGQKEVEPGQQETEGGQQEEESGQQERQHGYPKLQEAIRKVYG